MVVQFLADLPDVNVDGAIYDPDVTSPDGAEKSFTGYHLVGVGGKIVEHFELFFRKKNLFLIDLDDVLYWCDLNCPDGDLPIRVRFRFVLSKNGPHARQKFRDADRFDDEVICP